MNFLRKFKQRTTSPLDKNEQQLISLYNLVRTHGDEILSGKTKLSLTTPILILLNGTFQKYTGVNSQPCFEVANIGNETKHVQLISFLFEFLQKVVALKLISGPHSLDCPLLNVYCFKSLEILEIRKFPIIYIKNLNCIRRQLKCLICFRSTNSLKEVVNSFGKETEDLYTLPALTSLDLSYNTIKEIDDSSLRLLPSLEFLNLSFNCITSANSSSLPTVTHLNLGFNAITRIPSLPAKVGLSLTHLILRNNNLTTLKGLEALLNVEHLDIATNCLVNFCDLDPLAYLAKLLKLSLIDNPIYFNPNYIHCTIRKLSPIKRNGKITLDGHELDESVLQYLGQDVHPSLASYIPEKPIGVPRGSLLNLISSLPKLATSLPKNEGTPIQNGRIKQKAPVREATIMDYSSSPTALKSPYMADDAGSYQSSRSSPSSYSDKLSDTINSNIGNVFSSRRSSITNSLIWVNTNTGTETKQNDVSVKYPVVDYAAWPVEDANEIQNDDLLSTDSMDNHVDDIEDNIYGNVSALSLPTLEQEINDSPNDEAVVISVVSSDDVNDDDSTKSIDTILSECVDTDSTFLVQNVKRNKAEDIEIEEHLFLIFKLPYLIEKDGNGKLINKLDLNYLRDVKLGFGQLTVILTFDLMRSDWQHREYVFEQKDHVDSFMVNIQPIAVKNYQKKIAEMKHCECLKCSNVFLMKEEYLENLYCTECGSTMVIDKNENHIQQTEMHNDGNSAARGDHVQAFVSVSSIEIENLLNEPLPDELNRINDRNCQLVSSWPPMNFTLKNRVLRKCHSLPQLRCDLRPRLKLEEKTAATSSRKISQNSEHSKGSLALKNEISLSLYDRPNTDVLTSQKAYCSSPKYSSVSSGSSKYSSRLRRSSESRSSLKSDTFVTNTHGYKKCDHRLKLYLTISVYQHEDEEFVCQLRCCCSQYNKIQEYDCLLNISNKCFYLFSIGESQSDVPEDCFTKEAACSLGLLASVHYGYYNQSFIFEFSKPGCHYKFLTRDSAKTNEFIDLLKDEFEKMDCFDGGKPVFLKEQDKQFIHNIRRQVFSIPEKIKDMGERIYEEISLLNEGLLKSQKIRLRTHHQCFVARELIDWLLAHREVKSRSDGVELCNCLLDIGFIFSVLSKQNTFTDSDGLYKFSQNEKISSGYNEGEQQDKAGEEEMDTSIKLYSLAHVRISESDSTFHKRSLIITQSHIFLVNECHQWPLPKLHPPPPLLRDHFSMKARHKITNVTAVEYFEDAPCYANVCFVEEDSPLSGETDWLIQSESVEELAKVIDLIKTTWESLFLIELKVVTHISVMPLLECYVFVDD